MAATVYGAFENIETPLREEETKISVVAHQSRPRRTVLTLTAVIFIGCILFAGGRLIQKAEPVAIESLDLNEKAWRVGNAELETPDPKISSASFDDIISEEETKSSPSKKVLDDVYRRKHLADVANRKDVKEIKQYKNAGSADRKTDSKPQTSEESSTNGKSDSKTQNSNVGSSSSSSSQSDGELSTSKSGSSSSASSQTDSKSTVPKSESVSSSSSQSNGNSVIPKADSSSSSSQIDSKSATSKTASSSSSSSESNSESLKPKADSSSSSSQADNKATTPKIDSSSSSSSQSESDASKPKAESSSSSQTDSKSMTTKVESSSSSSSESDSESLNPKINSSRSSSQSSGKSTTPKVDSSSSSSQPDDESATAESSKSSAEPVSPKAESSSSVDEISDSVETEDDFINRNAQTPVSPDAEVESWEENTDSEDTKDSEKTIYVLGHHKSKTKWDHTDDEYGGHRDAIGEKETTEAEEAEAEEAEETETEEIAEEFEDDTVTSHSKKHKHKNKKKSRTHDTNDDSEYVSTIIESNDDAEEEATDIDMDASDCECVNSIDESRGEGACEYFIDHFKTQYGIDACSSLYCSTCDLRGSCDLECGICDDCNTNSTDTEWDNAPTTRHNKKDDDDDDLTKVVASGYLDYDNSTNTSVAYSSVECGDPLVLSTAGIMNFLVSTGNTSGMQTVSLDVCGVDDSVSTEIDVFLYDSCPYTACKNGGSDVTVLFKDVLRKSSDCITLSVNLDADTQQTGWLRLSPKDSNAEESFKIVISCDSGIAPTAAPGTPPAGWRNSGESEDIANPTASPTTPGLIVPKTEIICGQKIVDSTDGGTNFIGFPGPDIVYELAIAGASSFIATICPYTRSDNALWVYELPGGFADRMTGLGDLRAESGLRSGCTSIDYTVPTEHKQFWLVADGSKDGSFEIDLSCSFNELTTDDDSTADISGTANLSDSAASITVTDDLLGIVSSVFSENEYLAYNDSTLIASDYPWAIEQNCMVVEPYRNTTFRAELSQEYMHAKELQFRWKIHDRYYPTRSASAIFKEVGKYIVELEVYDVKQRLEKSIRTVYVRYIRREVRALTEYDRTKFLNVMKILYSTSTKEGVKAYGQDFKGMDYFSVKYASLAASSSCDRVSNGLGFLTNHAAITAELENSLQAVEAHLALPYWDFSLDAHSAYTQKKELHTDIELSDAWRRSEMFGDDLFGTTNPNNQYHAADRGRWGYLSIPSDMWNSTTDGVNAYGYLRAPWNLNDSPYVSRSDHVFEFQESTFSDCASTRSLLQSSKWSEFGSRIEDSMSLPNSIMVAGAWTKTTAVEWAETEFGHDAASKLAQISLSLSPIFYRANLLSCPEYCSSDSPSAKSCECSTVTGLTLPKIKEILLSSGAASRFTELDAHQDFHSVSKEDGSIIIEDRVVKAVWDMVGSSPMKGDMFQSSATLDPLFWVMHTNIERVWQWKRLSPSPYEYSWPSNSSVYGSCSGHDADDIIPFSNMFSTSASSDNAQYSNSEIYDLLDPTRTDASYIYDDFGWSHCNEEGYDIRNFDV